MQIIWDKVTPSNGKNISTWERIDKKEEVESLALQCMNLHFAQSNVTPLTSDDWISRLMDKEFQDSVLDGTIDLTTYSRPIQKFLSILQRPECVKKEVPFEYKLQDFESFIKSNHESTSASPSGRHYGHYKTIQAFAPKIFQDIHRIMALSMKYTIIPERYKKNSHNIDPQRQQYPKNS